ncbi:NAD(P)H-dependent oxidoreductase [Kribbella sp. NPDC051770]|uniref:NADPH-dependent FMN reductase n=1 Tax=Kribbella sp. NPDC051770 TaxID=3155413 RepID=UPI003431F40F
MIRIAIIIASTRPGRVGEQVGQWVHQLASKRGDAAYELIDLREQALPQLDEPLPAASGQYTRPHTRAWAELIAGYDGFVIVTPEYNHSLPASLKNALDFLYAEWHNKALGIVSYGLDGGTRAAETLRLVAGALKLADVRNHLALSTLTDFQDYADFQPAEHRADQLTGVLDEVAEWSRALAVLRSA